MAETIASAIRNCPAIDGFSLPGNRCVKICQYADDTTIFVLSDVALMAVFSLFCRYELASGAKLNVTKSHGLLVGSWRSRSNLPIRLSWSSQSITVMGAKLSNLAPEESWDSSLQQLDTVLSSWRARKLSYHGRALVINSFGLSQLWYLASFLVMPADIRSSIISRIFSFLWQGKREHLPRSSISQRISQGGLNVVDLDRKLSALHAMWVRRLLVGGDSPSTFFFRHHLRAAFAGRSLHQILLLPAPSQTALNALPPFYCSVIMSWFRLPCFMDAGTIFVGSPGSSSRSLSTLTVAFVYRLVSTLARTEHRCVAQYQSWGLAVEWNTVWSNLSLWRFLRPVRDTNWLIAHGVLPTADRLLRFGMSVDSKCHCGAVESLVHLFAQCPVARRVFCLVPVARSSCIPFVRSPLSLPATGWLRPFLSLSTGVSLPPGNYSSSPMDRPECLSV